MAALVTKVEYEKLFKASKNSTTLVGPADPYWSDVVAVFNMDDSLEGYSGIPGSTPSITQQTPDVGFITEPNYKLKMLDLSPGNAARLNIPDGYLSGDFTLEGYCKINYSESVKYLIGSNGIANGFYVRSPLDSDNPAVIIPGGSVILNSIPAWTFHWVFYFTFVRSGVSFRTFRNGGRIANDKIVSGYSFDFRSLFLGTYGFASNYNGSACNVSFGPIRLTKAARYWENFAPNWSTFLFPNHG